MNTTELNSPSHKDRKIANESVGDLLKQIEELKHPENVPEITISETGKPIKIPFEALKMLAKILINFKEGNAISLVPVAAELTTQKAAEFLNCSRPYVVKLIDTGKLPATKVGRHRRIKFSDLKEYKNKMIQDRKAELEAMMKESEEMGLYDL
ncbi:MAG: helix-turn-helix domain-containing protein [Fulvivirga sp.]|nr:helix-turn-helix domain-containing protein [Fulvivirga sp.]